MAGKANLQHAQKAKQDEFYREDSSDFCAGVQSTFFGSGGSR